MKSKFLVGAILVFLGAVFFAGKAILVRYNFIHYHTDAVSLLALRMLFSAPFYLVILFFQNRKQEEVPKLTKKEWGWMLLIGLVGYYLASIFDFWGLSYVTAAIERVVLFIYPTIVVMLSGIFLNKKIQKIQYVALVVTYIGVGIAFVPDIQLGLQKNVLIGASLVFLSAFTYALYLMGSGEMIPRVGAQRFTCYAMLISTGMVVIHYWISVGHGLFSLSMEVYGLSVIMAVFTTVIPSFMISEGIRRIGSSNASIIGSIGPVATIVMASSLLGEVINAWQVVGTLVVLGGVLMISWRGKK